MQDSFDAYICFLREKSVTLQWNMGRLLAIDFGRKRCGIAATDELRIIANPLVTVRTCDLETFVKSYVATNKVDKIIVGWPTTLRGEASESQKYLVPAINRLKKQLPDIEIGYYDERFTSVLAHKAMIDGGMKKSDRRDKAVVDMISASIILNDYLSSISSRL